MAAVTPIQGVVRRPSLFEISEHLEALLDSLDLCEDEQLRAECEAEITEYLSRQVAKVDAMSEYQDWLEAQKQMRKAQVVKLEKANRRADAILERIDNAILRTLDATNRKSLDGSLYSFSLRIHPPTVEVRDQSLVPTQYIRTTVSESVDKTIAKVDLKAGVSIPGLSLVTDRRGVVRK